MKILHICLASYYFEGMGYQENLLPKYHKKSGNDVTVLTTDFSSHWKYFDANKTDEDYVNDDQIRVKLVKRSKRYGYYSKFNDFDGVYNELSTIDPDIIFVHGGQFIALKDVIKYVKHKPSTKLYIDNHGDFYNIKVSTLKQKIAQKYIYGFWIRRAVKYTEKFWGVTPWRCQYLNEVYGVPKEKIGLLVMGGDDYEINFNKMPQLKKEIRKELNLTDEDFVIVTGGKIDCTKNIHLLAEAVAQLEGMAKLIIFGQPDSETSKELAKFFNNENLRFLGWIPSDKVYDYFLSSDLAVFPGTHSVLWEQACACGIPCVFKDWEGMHHVDIGGNCKFLQKADTGEIKEILSTIISDKQRYKKMKNAAEKGKKEFFYSEIAKRAIGQ